MKKLLVLPVLVGVLAFTAGCKEGGGEKAGKEFDKAVEGAKDNMQKAADKTADATKAAADKAKEATK